MRITALLIVGSLISGRGCGGGVGEAAAVNKDVLMDPNHTEMKKKAPAEFRAKFVTSAGDFVLEVERKLAPIGVDRFYNLVRIGFYDENRFFRVVPNFVVQFGMHGDPEVTGKWMKATIKDDPAKGRNKRGTITFAKTGAPNSRTTQLFINLNDNPHLDGQAFAPFGRVIEGMEVVDAINAEYLQKPNQQKIQQKGNEYLTQLFPKLDYVKQATIVD